MSDSLRPNGLWYPTKGRAFQFIWLRGRSKDKVNYWAPTWISSLLSHLLGFCPWVGKMPWRRKWQPTPVFLAGKSCGQRNLVGYSPWGRRVWHDLEAEHTRKPEDGSCVSLSRIQLFCDPMNYIAHQAPLSMGFSRWEYWSGSPFPPPGDLPDPGIQPSSPACVLCLLAQLCLTLCDPMHYSPWGSSVHGIFQARILEWMVAVPFSRESSQPRDPT